MRLDGESSPTDPLVPCLASYLAGQEGFEPTTSGFGDRRSNRWSYWPVFSLYLLSRCRVWVRQNAQNFLKASRSVVRRLFLVVV